MRDRAIVRRMRTLYHFVTSPFARRTRLALAHKKLDVVLKDSRAEPAYYEEVKKLWPLRQVPVLVEDDVVLGDSTAITHYLDGVHPGPRIWPADRAALGAALGITGLVDGALDTLVNLGDAVPPRLRRRGVDEGAGRAARAGTRGARPAGRSRNRPSGEADDRRGMVRGGHVDVYLRRVARRAPRVPRRTRWSRRSCSPWKLPAPLSRWADSVRDRDDVKRLDA